VTVIFNKRIIIMLDVGQSVGSYGLVHLNVRLCHLVINVCLSQLPIV